MRIQNFTKVTKFGSLRDATREFYKGKYKFCLLCKETVRRVLAYIGQATRARKCRSTLSRFSLLFIAHFGLNLDLGLFLESDEVK